eukprot:jgi/Psemu1/305684/fgenesh1_kg.212_\
MALRILFQPVHRLHWYNDHPFSVNLSIELLRRSLLVVSPGTRTSSLVLLHPRLLLQQTFPQIPLLL